jgi:hypothetical protein
MNPQGKSEQLPAWLSDLFFEPLVNETDNRNLRWYRTRRSGLLCESLLSFPRRGCEVQD